MQATLTTATYDAENKVLIPKEIPHQRDFQEVIVLFVPQTKIKTSRNRVIELLRENWEYNKNVPAEELNDAVSEAVAAVRGRPKEDLILD